MDRNLDGCYFRVERDGKWGPVCFSDLTPDERDRLFDNRERPAEWWKSLAYHLADCLRRVGDELDLVMEDE